ncbi:MAG: hypothetical protein ACHBN1_02530 [Heteroscytonema crispum UTEX LB 1556]
MGNGKKTITYSNSLKGREHWILLNRQDAKDAKIKKKSFVHNLFAIAVLPISNYQSKI